MTFKDGNIPWNKGKKLSDSHKKNISEALKGKPKSIEHRKKMPKFLKGEKHPDWKGDNVGYNGLHWWVHHNFTKPEYCEICGKKKKLEWSNKTNKTLRTRENWQCVCKSCHLKYDYKNELR